ncbi:MAG TPA: aminoacyl-tRNA hydrolase [Anaerolineae bacterium]|nr:aminoacyl-tRNA hydrolase [Anaerolineae bacterium]
MKLVVGLGNPGPRYANNRHNVGFLCVRRIAVQYGSSHRKLISNALVTPVQIRGIKVALARPLAFMNRSGQAVASLSRRYAVALSDLLVIYDDLDLPLGRIRLREGGGAGGHKGMLSIIDSLGGDAFPRLRIGIGRPAEGEPSDYVLSDFAPDEIRTLEATYELAIAAVESFVTAGIVAAMNTFNTPREPPDTVQRTGQEGSCLEPDQSA